LQRKKIGKKENRKTPTQTEVGSGCDLESEMLEMNILKATVLPSKKEGHKKAVSQK